MVQKISKAHLNFQAKILIPILLIMVTLVAAIMFVVNSRFSRKMLDDTNQTLLNAKSVLFESLAFRNRDLISRYENLANEPRIRSISSGSVDPKTVQNFLAEFIQDLHADFIGLRTDKGQVISSPRDPKLNSSELERAIAPFAEQAFSGEKSIHIIRLKNRLFNLVSIPVFDPHPPKHVAGVVTFGDEINDAVALQLKKVTQSEIVLVSDGQVVASTVSTHIANSARDRVSSETPLPISLDNKHYRTLAGDFKLFKGDPSVSYLLLSSYEQPFRELQSTQELLFTVSLLGILCGAVTVWGIVRKLTEPLRSLRDSAEKVGAGDLGHRVAVTSSDEYGQLAMAFNSMTANLEGSRKQLEKTLEALKNTQAQLVQREKLSAIGEFVAGVTHELNNPLTSVIGFSELLKQSDSNPSHQRFLNSIVAGAQRCHKIVQSLLSFARQHPPERKFVCANEMIETTLDFVRYELTTNNIQAEQMLDPNLPPIFVDRHQIEQVFLNIINNARQALENYRSDGRLTLRTEVAGEKVRISLSDNGPGISPENLTKVFNPFFTTKPVGKGTGLGLSLSYGIVQEHGGSITVESQAGKGTTFVIEFPAANAARSAVGLLSGPQAPVSTSSNPAGAALVIDDEPSLLELISVILEHEGYKVTTAHDGESALRLLGRQRYDLTLCDWKMPGLDGKQTYERLQTSDPDAATRFVFMTGDIINEATQDFLKAHGRACIAKPFSIAELRAAVNGFRAETR